MLRAMLWMLVWACALAACGGGASNGNSVPLAINGGPAAQNSVYVNGVFASVTVCVPSTTQCQTIDGVLVDTGSSGLRLLSSVLTLPLQKESDDQGLRSVASCVAYADGSYTWGPVVLADVKLGGEQASSVPIQVIADPSSSAFQQPPADCTSGGGTNEGTVDSLGANGILGVSSFRYDCGSLCTTDTSPGMYFGCSASGCVATTLSEGRQLPNPVFMFGGDNNGVAIQLPGVSAGGEQSTSGTLLFGIGTQSDNALGAAKVLLAGSDGNVTTQFRGNSYAQSFLDSGSNGIFFLDAASSGIATCSDTASFYCPPSPVQLSASLVGSDGRTADVTIGISDADACLNSGEAACGDLAGPNSPADSFLWGLPFFYGRTVFTAIEGQGTPGGTGPFWAL